MGEQVVIGVLALQGAVREHIRLLEQAGAIAVAVKKPQDLEELDGLVIPGGESTTISKLMEQYALTQPILEMHQSGKPLFGTCAGLILLGKDHLNVMDIKVARNAFGRQKDSFEASLKIEGVGEGFEAVFIRAPLIEQVGEAVHVLAKLDGEQIVAVRQGTMLGAAFHPELTDDLRFHAYFVQMVEDSRVAS